jgi:hypothetical protein
MARNDLMEPPVRPDGLQIDDNRPGQERFWFAERVAHGVFALFVLVALLGLTGANGPLAEATVAGEAGRLTHPRVARWQTPFELRLVLETGPGEHQVELKSPQWGTLRVDDVQPQPAAAQAIAGGLRWTIAADEPAADITVHLTPTFFGRKVVAVSLRDAAPLTARVLVLP